MVAGLFYSPMATIPMPEAALLIVGESKRRNGVARHVTAHQRRHLKRILIDAPAGDVASGFGLFGLLWLVWAGAAVITILSVG